MKQLINIAHFDNFEDFLDSLNTGLNIQTAMSFCQQLNTLVKEPKFTIRNYILLEMKSFGLIKRHLSQ